MIFGDNPYKRIERMMEQDGCEKILRVGDNVQMEDAMTILADYIEFLREKLRKELP